MKKTAITTFAFLLIYCTASAGPPGNKQVGINRIAKALQAAVMREDVGYLMRYVSPSGTYFIDGVYSFEEIKNSMEDRNGWLNKHIFSSDNSIKSYFLNAKNLKIKVHHRNKRSIMISYQSSNYDPTDWVECCLIKEKGKWYFDGVFYCR